LGELEKTEEFGGYLVYLNTDIDLRLFLTKKQELLWESQRPFKVNLFEYSTVTTQKKDVQKQHENLQ